MTKRRLAAKAEVFTVPAIVGRLALVALATMPLVMSCQPQVNAEATSGTVSETGSIAGSQSKDEPAKPSGSVGGVRSQKITFRTPNGTPEFSLQFKSSGGKLLDASGNVIANLILQCDGAVKLTDANNNVVGYVNQTEDAVLIESPKRSKTLFSFVQQSDGNALLTRNNGSTVYQLTATDDGYSVDSGKAALYAVQAKKGSGQLQTTNGQTVMAADGEITPAALAAFGFEKLSQAQQAGLAYALSIEST